VSVPPELWRSSRGTDFGPWAMTDEADSIKRPALEMVVRLGAGAARVTRGLAEGAEEQQRDSARAWRNIADAVERFLTTS
jgi:hypothetical protein